MERLDHTRTVVAALVHLGDAGFDQQTNDRVGADHVGCRAKSMPWSMAIW